MSTTNRLVLKKEIVKTMALLYPMGLATPRGGNVSARVKGSGNFWITPTGVFKVDLKPSDLVKVTLDGKVLSGRLKPSVETPMHSSIYRTRSDVLAVIHAHSPLTLGVALAGVEIKPATPESFLQVGEVPVVQFDISGTEELASKVVEVLRSHNVAVMQNHGVVAVGRTLFEALNRLEIVEFTARIMTTAHIWGGSAALSASQIEKIRHRSTA